MASQRCKIWQNLLLLLLYMCLFYILQNLRDVLTLRKEKNSTDELFGKENIIEPITHTHKKKLNPFTMQNIFIHIFLYTWKYVYIGLIIFASNSETTFSTLGFI